MMMATKKKKKKKVSGKGERGGVGGSQRSCVRVDSGRQPQRRSHNSVSQEQCSGWKRFRSIMARSLPFLIRHAFVCLLAAVVGTHAIATNSGRKNIDDILDGHMDASYKNNPFAMVASANIKAERINNASRSNVTSPAADMIRSKLHLFKTATRFEKELNNTSQMHPTWRDNGIEKIKYTYGVKAIKNTIYASTPAQDK